MSTKYTYTLLSEEEFRASINATIAEMIDKRDEIQGIVTMIITFEGDDVRSQIRSALHLEPNIPSILRLQEWCAAALELALNDMEPEGNG